MKTKTSNRKIFILLGLISPIMYFAPSFAAPPTNEGYSHIVHSVSDLLIVGMNNRMIVDVMMLISNLASVAVCIAIFVYYKKGLSKGIKAGIIMIGLTGLSNVMSTYVFRLQESTEGMTFSTIMHITFVATSALFVIIGALLIAFNIIKLAKYFQWKRVKLYTFLSLSILTVGGLLSPFIISNGIEIVGIVERVSILAYHQWFIVMTLKFYSGSNLIEQ